ncbi:MAG: RIP metalloprotease RseP, partial [Deltaproteobacteria bacterium]|nr:RIP metalloprotease RseP [Deltaproteobacteria bacterium]
MTLRTIFLGVGLPMIIGSGLITQSLQGTFAFVLLLGVLITIHEFGHFAVAKLCGVKVLKFSIGFGNPIGFGKHRMLWKVGETEYVVAWIPVGGFVKMLGENPDEEDSDETLADPERALANKPVWQKLAVVAAGPAMNLIFPVFLLMGFLFVGIPHGVPVVGHVEADSPAAEAGFLSGDRILTIDGESVEWWDDLLEGLRESSGESLAVRIDRNGYEQILDVEIAARSGLDRLNALNELGWIGVGHSQFLPLLNVKNNSAAQAAGLQPGDRITAVNGEKVETWANWAQAYSSAPMETTVSLEVQRGEEETVQVQVSALGDLKKLGVLPAVVRVGEVSSGSAAGDAGVKAGDLLLSVDGTPLASFSAFREIVLKSKGRALELSYVREGQLGQLSVSPRMTESTIIEGMTEEIYLIGIGGQDEALAGVFEKDIVRNPLESFPKAFEMTVEITQVFIMGLGKIISGEIPRNQVGGPMRIAEEAHRAFQSGWDRYLNLMILISINLGILNLLPIPVLDGGQALIFTAEGLKGSPLSTR